MNEISLWLDSYDDIYSVFDSRHYLKRRISEDFVDELRIAFKYKHEQPEAVSLLLPANRRNSEIENAIATSLKEQISERREILDKKLRNTWRWGVSLSVAGLLVMLVDSIIVYKAGPSYVGALVKVVMEPAGWFMIWRGLDLLTYDYRTTKRERKFYLAVERLHVYFKDT